MPPGEDEENWLFLLSIVPFALIETRHSKPMEKYTMNRSIDDSPASSTVASQFVENDGDIRIVGGQHTVAYFANPRG